MIAGAGRKGATHGVDVVDDRLAYSEASRETPTGHLGIRPIAAFFETRHCQSRMNFALTQTASGFWGWMLMQGTECIARSARSFPTELACRMEIERLRSEFAEQRPAVSRPMEHEWDRRPMASF